MIDRYCKPWPWNSVPDPRPADWGFGMTVCIAAISQDNVILASDKMISMGFTSVDDVADKCEVLSHRWHGMMAGDDVSPLIPILEKIHRAPASTGDTLAGIAGLVSTAFQEQRDQMAEESILRPLLLDRKTFLERGREVLYESEHDLILERLKHFNLDCQLLVAGFDDDQLSERPRTPHIFTVTSPGKCTYYDKLGFWTIGSGQNSALSSLFASRYKVSDDLPACIYNVIAAKFTAETAPGVGKETFVTILGDRGRKISFLSGEKIDSYKTKWASLPRIPEGLLEDIAREMADERFVDLETIAEKIVAERRRKKEQQKAESSERCEAGSMPSISRT